MIEYPGSREVSVKYIVTRYDFQRFSISLTSGTGLRALSLARGTQGYQHRCKHSYFSSPFTMGAYISLSSCPPCHVSIASCDDTVPHEHNQR